MLPPVEILCIFNEPQWASTSTSGASNTKTFATAKQFAYASVYAKKCTALILGDFAAIIYSNASGELVAVWVYENSFKDFFCEVASDLYLTLFLYHFHYKKQHILAFEMGKLNAYTNKTFVRTIRAKSFLLKTKLLK